MLKVLYVVSTLENKGPTNQLFNIVTNLDKNKFQPIILTLSPEKQDSQYDKFVKKGIEIISLNLSRVEGVVKAGIYLKRAVKKIKPSIIHTQGLRADILSAKHLKNIKRVCTLRNYPFEDYPMKFGNLKGKLMAFQHLKAINKIDVPIACSRTLSNQLNLNLNKELEYIQNGVDTNEYSSINLGEKEHLRGKLNLPLEKRVFISVGSLIKRKDPLNIIKAFKNRSNSENSILIMVGDGPLRNECESYVRDDKGIYFTGQIKNVNDYLRASDFFVSSSLSEGLPNTVLEALATGLPCCLSNIEPHKEILSFNNNAGTLFKVNNNNDLKDVIDLIQSVDYSLASKESRNLIEKHLSASVMSKSYQELYLRLKRV